MQAGRLDRIRGLARRVHVVKKLMYVREHLIETHLRKLCAAKDWLCAKFVSPGLRGVPDRVVFKGIDDAVTHYMATHLCDYMTAEREVRNVLALCVKFVELKAPGEKPTAQQLRRHKELHDLGFEVAVLDSQEAVDVWVENA